MCYSWWQVSLHQWCTDSMIGWCSPSHSYPLTEFRLPCKIYNLVINFIRMFDSLYIICFTPLFSRRNGAANSEDPQWPSWLPGWRVQVKPKAVPLLVSQPGRGHIDCFRPLPWPELQDFGDPLPVFSACGSIKLDVHVNLSNRTLSCKGVFVDKIDGIATELISNCGETCADAAFVQSTSPTNTPGPDPIPSEIKALLLAEDQSAVHEDQLVDDIICGMTANRFHGITKRTLRKILVSAQCGFFWSFLSPA